MTKVAWIATYYSMS